MSGLQRCEKVSYVLSCRYTVEVFPTVVRNQGVGSSSLCARVGSVLAPLTFPLAAVNPALFPTGLLGIVFLACAGAWLLLPETYGVPLPRTVQELEERKR